jgi:hypothetical protein
MTKPTIRAAELVLPTRNRCTTENHYVRTKPARLVTVADDPSNPKKVIIQMEGVNFRKPKNMDDKIEWAKELYINEIELAFRHYATHKKYLKERQR